jgi:hypothetical protein
MKVKWEVKNALLVQAWHSGSNSNHSFSYRVVCPRVL